MIYRVTGDKDKIGSWQDVADILNELLGTEYTESKFRKQRQVFDKMLSANRSKFVDSDSQMKELNLKLDAIRKERIKLQTVNIERNRIDRGVSRQEMYYEYVGMVCDALPLPDFNPLYDYDDYSTEKSFSEEYLVGIADVHYGAKFKSENNEYSPEIAKDRLEYLGNELVRFIKDKKLPKLHIVCLGDLLQGLIHLSDLKINDSTVVKSTVEVSRLIASLLNELSRFVKIEYYHVPMANHTQTRSLGTRPNELMDEDLEYLIGNYIKDLCRDNERISIHLADEGKGYIDIPILGNEIVALHGHQIKSIENSLKDLSMLRRSFIDVLLMGHFHAGKELTSNEGCCSDCEVLIAPSFVGSDPYSDSLMKGSKAAVKIYGFNEVYGHDETYKIILN